MRTLADIKRRIVVGAKMHTIFHRAFDKRDGQGGMLYKDEDKGIREVSIKQSNSFALKTTKTDGTVVDSWCQYPKAAEVVIKDTDTFTITETDREGKTYDLLTYKFID